MIVLNKGSVHLDGSTIMLIAEMMTAIRSVRAIVEKTLEQMRQSRL